MSKAEKPRSASLDVISPVLTQRATAEANGCRKVTGVFARKNAAARPVRVDLGQCDEHARVEIDGHCSSSITKTRQKLTGIRQRDRLPYPMLGKPILVGGRHRPSGLCDRPEHRDRMAVPRDHDLPARKSTVD
jgi:hypothetical protein